jgi:hypothetical protein
LAVLLAVLAGLLVWRRYRRSKATAADNEEAVVPSDGEGTPPKETPASLVPDASQGTNIAVPQEQDAAAITNQLRILQDQVQQLIQDRAEGSSTAGSDTASVTRSLSTMKRDQTRVVREHQLGHVVTDSLVHTDSGLRLTAGRVVDELPPTYVAD